MAHAFYFGQSLEALPSTFWWEFRVAFKAEPITADSPILTHSVFEGHAARGRPRRSHVPYTAWIAWIA